MEKKGIFCSQLTRLCDSEITSVTNDNITQQEMTKRIIPKLPNI